MTENHYPDANDVLFGQSGPPAVQWQNKETGQDLPVGTSYEGPIVSLDSTQQRNIQDKSKLDTWPDGKPKMIALVGIQTNQRDPSIDADDGKRTIWVSGKYMTDATREAVKRSGAKGLELGGYFKVTLTGYGKAQPGFRAPRLFSIDYRRPDPAAAANAALAADPWATQEAANQAPLDGSWPGVNTPAATGAPTVAASPAQASSGAAQTPVTAPTGATVDLSTLDEKTRAVVERMMAEQAANR